MAETLVGTRLAVKQWETDFFVEYVRDSRFARYTGTGMNNIIYANERLSAKKGDRVVIPFAAALSGTGVQGNTPLEGNEEELYEEGFEIPVTTNRNAVATTEEEEDKSAIEILDAAKPALKIWIMESLRGGTMGSLSGTAALANPLGIIDNLYSFFDGTNYALYPNASEAIKDAWLANNSDRVQFGALISNNSSNDHSASLQNIDNTADKFTAASLRLMKSRAKEALNPKITPYRAQEDEEWYVAFAGSRAFRDFSGDAEVTQANREGWNRYGGEMGKGANPLFRGGDLILNGVIVREVPEMPVLTGVGAGNIDVQPVFLCGIGAIGVGWAKRPQVRSKSVDYDFRKGTAIQERRGVRKLYYRNKQHGVYTAYFAAVAAS